VHGQHVLVGQQVVQDREHRLLDLARVPGAADRHDAVGEVHEHGAVRRRAVERWLGLEAWQVQDGEVGLEVGQFLDLRPQEHVAGEEIVPSRLRDHAHADTMLRIGAGPAVTRKQLAALRIGDHAVVEGAVTFGRHGLVGLAPVDALLGLGILDKELVIGRTAGMHARADHEGAAVGNRSLMSPHGLFVEGRH